MKKTWYIYTMDYYSALRKDEMLPFETTWMDLEIIMLSEINQEKISTPDQMDIDLSLEKWISEGGASSPTLSQCAQGPGLHRGIVPLAHSRGLAHPAHSRGMEHSEGPGAPGVWSVAPPGVRTQDLLCVKQTY
uniref:DUF1725 domain-containing protein n=1 Tax=Rousettus aegyptiacus TaxID=9407 RepID=A0A7J8D6Y0_ROUAE|nr:hypothetical protein HJG63_008898 [Rousettus aegyptiacus]